MVLRKPGQMARFSIQGWFSRKKSIDMAEELGDGADLLASGDLRTLTPNLPRKVMVKLSAFIEIKRELGHQELGAALRRCRAFGRVRVWSANCGRWPSCS